MAANAEVVVPWGALGRRVESHPKLVAALSLVALGGVLATAGFAKLYSDVGNRQGLVLAAFGIALVATSGAWTVRLLEALPDCPGDCERYGRHMIGMTYLLLLLGLCNGVGTSILALDGGLSFSASQLVLASDPARVVEADKQHADARQDRIAKDRAISDAKRVQLRAEDSVARACSAGASSAEAEGGECSAARARLFDAQSEVIKRNYEYDDAYTKTANAELACARTRAESKAALFFLLSISTLMSLFGATFYVVNRVRSKRPLLTDEPDNPDDAIDDEPAPDYANGKPPTARSDTSDELSAGESTGPQPPHSEPFDVHAFWSGAFFRVGEAMLFTFAFFWMIWTNGDRTYVVWMPVLGLFVGMFVRTGEAVVFRLGERVLHATESLLPSVDRAPRQPAPK